MGELARAARGPHVPVEVYCGTARVDTGDNTITLAQAAGKKNLVGYFYTPLSDKYEHVFCFLDGSSSSRTTTTHGTSIVTRNVSTGKVEASNINGQTLRYVTW